MNLVVIAVYIVLALLGLGLLAMLLFGIRSVAFGKILSLIHISEPTRPY